MKYGYCLLGFSGQSAALEADRSPDVGQWSADHRCVDRAGGECADDAIRLSSRHHGGQRCRRCRLRPQFIRHQRRYSDPHVRRARRRVGGRMGRGGGGGGVGRGRGAGGNSAHYTPTGAALVKHFTSYTRLRLT